MKIVYCIAKTHGSGGMERVLSTKANYLAERGYEIIIVTTDQCGKKSFFPLDDRIRCYDLDVNYERNNGKSFLNKIVCYPFKQRKHKRKLSQLLKELQADIVISMFCNDASFITKIRDGSKKVLEIHFSKFKRLQYGRKGIWGLADRLRSKMDEQTVRKFDRFVVLTWEDRGYWGDLSGIQVIPNPVPFHPVGISFPDIKLNTKKVIAVGRYDFQKGFDLLIDAWEVVHQSQPEWTLDIIGEGELLNQLQRQIEENGLLGNVRLKLPTSRMEEVYGGASILVLSSRYEGLPMVLLEAQAFGLPVVSFACKCGPRDIITDGQDGFLVPEQDVERLAIRILRVIDDEDLRMRMGHTAKQNSERFSKVRIMRRWTDLFETLSVQEGGGH